MALVGILYSQTNVIIGAKNSSKKGVFGALADDLKDSLVKTWTASTSRGIVIDATVNEEHVSSCEITENPVEDGAKITDHVQLNPSELTIEGVISDTPLGYAIIGNIQNLVKSVSTLFGGTARSIDAYNDMLELQRKRTPFTVITGLKRYSNMIMTELSVPRTSETGKALHFSATMREIRIVKSKSTTGINLASNVSNLGSSTKNLGQNVTKAVPATGVAAKTSDKATPQGAWIQKDVGF